MDDIIRRAVEAVPEADYAEARIHRVRGAAVAFAGRELEDIGESSSFGGCVRVLVKGAWGFCAFNDIARIEDRARQALAHARMIGGGTARLAPTAPARQSVSAGPQENPQSVSLAEKEALCRRYNDLLRAASPRIQTTSVRYGDAAGTMLFANSEGARIEQAVAHCAISLAAIAMDGANIQTGRFSVGDLRGFQICRNLEQECDRAARQAVDLLSARPADAGTYTIICDPNLAGVFAHEAFGHLSEADAIYEHDSLREMMKLGRRFGSEELCIVDDATLPGENGSYAFDHEGTAAQRTYLLREGRLAGRLHSRETAALMDEAPTGNARATGYNFEPIVRMSNTFIEPRDMPFEAMLASTPDGLYARGFLGGQTDMEMFTFSAERAWRIRDGKLAEPLRDVHLSGNVFHTLGKIDAIGNDLEIFGGVGGCGKGDQWPLRVGTGGPHVRIRDVVVGGE